MCDSNPTTLKILLVDQSPQRRPILEKILYDNGYRNVFATSGLQDLFDLVTSYKPDVVLIELDSPGRDTLEQLQALRYSQPTPVLMFAQDHDTQTVHAAVESGVCAYMVDSVDRATIKPAIALAMATFNSFRRLQHEAERYRHQLDYRKQLDEAKILMMKHEQLSENEAYLAIRRIAMDQNRKLASVAEEIIAKYRSPKKKS